MSGKTELSSERSERFPDEVRKARCCRATDKAGETCMKKVLLGNVCTAHAASAGLAIRPSRFGGLGLFAKMPEDDRDSDVDKVPVFVRGTAIAEYGGILVDSNPGDRYAMAIDDLYIDARESSCCLARFANDGTLEGTNNAEFVHYGSQPSSLLRSGDGKRMAWPSSVWIVADREIYDGQEILVSYGDDYWADGENRI